MTSSSSEYPASPGCGSDGTAPAASYSTPLCTSRVASPPSSRIMFGPASPGQTRICSVHSQYSSSDSPFHANTGTPAGASTEPERADDDRGRGLVLRREDVARRPADLRAERDERLDEHRGLHRHVQRAGDARAGQRLGRAELGAQGHEPRHLVLGEADLVAAGLGEGQVADLVAAGELGERWDIADISLLRGALRWAGTTKPGYSPRRSRRRDPSRSAGITHAVRAMLDLA